MRMTNQEWRDAQVREAIRDGKAEEAVYKALDPVCEQKLFD